MHTTDSKAVSRAMTATIRPILRAAGFTAFTGKKAWRYTEHTVDIVAFASMNDYIANGVGCTTFSFGGEAGVLYRAVESEQSERPHEASMTFRGTMQKYVRQPFFHPYGRDDGSDRSDIWYVLPDGSNLEAIVADAAIAVVEQGLPHLRRFDDPARALDALRTERWSIDDQRHGHLTVFAGNPASQSWLAIHAALVDAAGARNLDAATAPVLSPAERWLVKHESVTHGSSRAEVVLSLESDELEPVIHQLPLTETAIDDGDFERGDHRVHVYLLPDGTVGRTNLF